MAAMRLLRTLGISFSVALALVLPAQADATQRFTVPSGGVTSGGACSQQAPCSLRHAIVDVAQSGDEVIVEPGASDYSESSQLDSGGKPLDIHGVAGQPRPRVAFASGGLFIYGGGVRDLTVESPDIPLETGPSLNPAVIDRVSVRQTSASATGSVAGVQLATSWVLRDSVVQVADADGQGVVDNSGDARMVNDTVVAPGGSSTGVNVSDPTGSHTVTVVNTIVRAATDLQAGTGGTIDVSYSNYRSQNVGGGALIDGGHNQRETDPIFVDASAGDFHQTAASPTVDAGTVDPQLGPLDFDGQPRAVGHAPDIGADELPVPTAVTKPASSVTAASARLNGIVSPNGLATTYRFEYGYTTAYGHSTPTQAAGAGISGLPVSALIAGLPAGTLVHFRLVAQNSAGTTAGVDRSFRTRPECLVPKIVGKKLRAAKRAIRRSHCRVGKITRRKSSGRPGRVLAAHPKPGSRRHAGFKVRLVVSKR